MPYNLESTTTICAASVEHDPKGTHAKFYKPISRVLECLYTTLQVNFTTITHPDTINAARDNGWCVNHVNITDSPTGRNRFFALKSALEKGCDFINLWDGDHLIHAVIKGKDDLFDFVAAIPKYDFLIAGATRGARDSHQRSMVVWEDVKSWALGYFLGIEGDIANRGCLAFSKEFTEFAAQYPLVSGDDTDGIFPLLSVAYKRILQEKKIDNGRQPLGYREYKNALRYEDWLFEGVTSKKSAQRKNTYADFIRRAESVIRIIVNAQRINDQFALNLFEGESFLKMINRLSKEL